MFLLFVILVMIFNDPYHFIGYGLDEVNAGNLRLGVGICNLLCGSILNATAVASWCVSCSSRMDCRKLRLTVSSPDSSASFFAFRIISTDLRFILFLNSSFTSMFLLF